MRKTFTGRSKKYDLTKRIPVLIKQNEELWEKKSESFRVNHKPKRKWREIWTEYDKRH